MRLAIFDFDGTIYQNETFKLLMEHLKEHPVYHALYKPFCRSIIFPYMSYKVKLFSETKMKKSLMKKYLQTFKGFTKDEVEEYFAEVAEKMENNMNEEVLSRMQQNKADGYFIMIVSGAFTPLLEKALKNLPVDKIIGTDVAYTDDYFDHTAPIDHVHAKRKTELIQQYFSAKHVDWENSFAYADSFTDIPVLELVGNPVAVNPDEKLREVAEQNRWKII